LTPEALRMRAIVDEQAPLLKEAGFKRRRHSFNRFAGDGLVHVVYFWMAPKEPPAWTEVPGLRERLYGSFRLDFGVHVPEMTRTHTPRSSWINDYDCHLRRTIGQLISRPYAPDSWWKLDDPEASANADTALRSAGLPWLDSFPDANSILDSFDEFGPIPLGLGPAGSLDIADLYRARGDEERERRVLIEYVSHPVLQSHIRYLTTYLDRHGHQDLVPDIKGHPPA
jgi:hypothetical protein